MIFSFIMKVKTQLFIVLTHFPIYLSHFVNGFNVDTEYPIEFGVDFHHKSDKYFGLSVEMQSTNSEVVFIIGAPKANSSHYNYVKNSGTIFKCHLSSDESTKCNEILLDFHRISSNSRIKVNATNDMFLGGTIVSRPESSQVVVCGHKWSQELHRNRVEHQINPSGSCFMLDVFKPSEVVAILPLTDTNLQNYRNTYYYSHSMSGFSASFTSRGQHLLLGAPGFYQWRGTFLEVNPIDQRLDRVVGEKFLMQSLTSPNSESYAGYSLVSGHFFSGIDNTVCMSAPRDNNLKGKVYIYNLRNGQHSETSTSLKQFSHIEGLQIGEYFGASLLSINLNNDLYSDLIVGAPLYSSKELGDCGRVFVYVSTGNGFSSTTILNGIESSNARFGTALAHLGDLNFDGYHDIAIGAPYEDERGVVYIYYGSETGIKLPFAQRISARQHFGHIQLKGFGISISGNRDVDKNHYNDILIGSYLSNKAVLLRTKPIVKMSANIELNSTFININDKNCYYIESNTRVRKKSSCISLTYCAVYRGSHLSPKLYFNFTLLVDNKRPENQRCFVEYANQMRTYLTKVQEINAEKLFCSDPINVFLKETTQIDDFFTPIEFILSYSVVNIQSKQSFCPNCPTIENNQNVKNELHFKTGCKTDEKCVSTLKLSSKTLLNSIPLQKSDSIFEGFHKSLSLITSVINSGEPSYLTKILISTNPNLNFLRQDSRCHLIEVNSSNSIECEVGNPLYPNLKEEVSIHLDISKLDRNTDHLEIDIEVKTASDVTKESHLNENFEINVIRNASLDIFGYSNTSEIVYESEDQRKSDLIPFTGIFQINKINFSSVQNILIEFQIPSSFNKEVFLYEPVFEGPINAYNREVNINCNQTISGLPVMPSHKTIYRFKRNTIQKEKRKKTLKLDCKSHINCKTIKCFGGPFDNEKKSTKLFIHSALNIKTIESIFGQKFDEIKLFIKTKAMILDKEIFSNSTQISTIFLFKRLEIKREFTDQFWIILISFGVGVLILIIITIILWKFGFFKRLDKNQMKSNDENKVNSDINGKENNSLLDFEENDSEIQKQ